MLAEVPDPRKKKGRRHPLVSMLALTGVGLLCGQRSYTQIAKWARIHVDLRQALGFTAKQTPAASTFHYLFRRKEGFTMKGKKPVKSSEPTTQRKKSRKRSQGNKWGAPMVASGNKGTTYTYPTGDSEDY